MESEEFEQIPWANLVAEQTDGIDKRIYIAAGVVGILIVAVLGVRLVGAGGQPLPPRSNRCRGQTANTCRVGATNPDGHSRGGSSR